MQQAIHATLLVSSLLLVAGLSLTAQAGEVSWPGQYNRSYIGPSKAYWERTHGRSGSGSRATTRTDRGAAAGAHRTPTSAASTVGGSAYQCALKKAKAYLQANGRSKGLKDDVITLVDLDASSSSQRMVIVNPLNNQIISKHTVAKGSGGISTSAGSHGSELGFMKVSETYSGKHGLSAKIDGLEGGNRDARSRAIVIHGASYVTEGGNAGRSWGCFAVDNRSVASVVRQTKGGTLLYSYQGSKACH